MHSSTSAATKFKLGEFTSGSCLLLARRIRSFSIRRHFPVLDPTLKLFQTYRNRRSRCRIFAAYVRSLCRWQFYGRVHIIRSRGDEFLPDVISRRLTPFPDFNAAINRHPYLKFFPFTIVRSRRNAGATSSITITQRITVSPRMSDRKFIVVARGGTYKRD